MAITDTEKLDFLWKRIIGGVTKTASSLVKFLSNETIPSPLPVFPSSVWQDGDSIPATPPVSDTAIIKVYYGSNAIRMTNDPTAPINVAWIATSSYGDTTSRMKNFVPFTSGSGYSVQVFIGNPNTGPAARIFPDTTGEEWVFDYAAGVLIFATAVPSNKAATVGSGTVSVASDGIYIQAYQYIGGLGVGSSSGASSLAELTDVDLGTASPSDGDVLTYEGGVWVAAASSGGGSGSLGTISTQDADNVNITGGSISDVTLSGVTIDGGTF